jgi:hypothetical protein
MGESVSLFVLILSQFQFETPILAYIAKYRELSSSPVLDQMLLNDVLEEHGQEGFTSSANDLWTSPC